jgi:hypothetical protein
VPVGSTVTVRTRCYTPGEQVLITVRSVSCALGTAAADENGRVRTQVTLPDGLPPGNYTLLVQGFTDDGAYLVTGATLNERVGGYPETKSSTRGSAQDK